MLTPEYSTIEHLIAEQDVQARSVEVTFRCELTGVARPASGPLKRLDSFQSQATRSVKKNLWSSLRRSATRTLSDALGSGAAGKIARDLTNTGIKQAEKKNAFSQEEVRAAIVAAFQTVASDFQLDESTGRWIGNATVTSSES